MTNEQYYWFVQRQNMLRAYARHMTNLNSQANSVGCDGSLGANVVDTVEDFEKAVADEKVKAIKLNATMALPDGDKGVLVETGRDLTIDLNSQSMTAAKVAPSAEGGNQDAIIAVKRGAKLTLNGPGTISVDGTATSLYAPIKLSVKGEAEEGADPEVVINGGTYKGRYYAVVGNGTRQGGVITINNGTLDAGNDPDGTVALYQPMRCKTTINSGTLTGTNGIVIKGGSCIVNDGTVIGTGAQVEFKHNGNGWNNTGDAFAVEACDYPAGIPDVKIYGGKFISENAQPIASYAQDGYEDKRLVGFVYGGTFNKKINDDLVADGYQQVQLPDGTWTIEQI